MTRSSLGQDTVGLQGNIRAVELHDSRFTTSHRGLLQRGQDAIRKLRSRRILETQAMEHGTGLSRRRFEGTISGRSLELSK